jgi:hypothetical protein
MTTNHLSKESAMPKYSVVLRVEKIYEVEASDEEAAIEEARSRMQAGDRSAIEEESDDPSVEEMES